MEPTFDMICSDRKKCSTATVPFDFKEKFPIITYSGYSKNCCQIFHFRYPFLSYVRHHYDIMFEFVWGRIPRVSAMHGVVRVRRHQLLPLHLWIPGNIFIRDQNDTEFSSPEFVLVSHIEICASAPVITMSLLHHIIKETAPTANTVAVKNQYESNYPFGNTRTSTF